MDQNAFRSLLSAPRPSGATNESGEGGGSRSKNVLGKAAPKRGWGLKPKDTKAYEKPSKSDKSRDDSARSFQPRALQGHRKVLAEGGYKDRAALRRSGVDDEYKEVETLLTTWEEQARAAGADDEEIEKQRAYLGGDATHSILVKGLDRALLAARKAELAREDEGKMEEELEGLGRDLGKGRRGDGSVKGKGKGREGEGDEDEEGRKGKSEVAEKLGRGFKSIGAKASTSTTKDGKKKKKKAKAGEASLASASVPAEKAPTGLSKPAVPDDEAAQLTAGPGLSGISATDKASKASKAPPPAVEEEDDEDIFADAGEYDLGAAAGDSDSDSDNAAADEKNPPGSRGRSRSRDSRDSRDSKYREDGRGRSYSRDRYDTWEERGRSRPYDSRSRSRSRSYSRSRSRSRSYDRSYSYSRSRSRSRDRGRAYAYSRSPARRDEQSRERRRQYSRSPVYRERDSTRRADASRPRSRSRSRDRYYDSRDGGDYGGGGRGGRGEGGRDQRYDRRDQYDRYDRYDQYDRYRGRAGDGGRHRYDARSGNGQRYPDAGGRDDRSDNRPRSYSRSPDRSQRYDLGTGRTRSRPRDRSPSRSRDRRYERYDRDHSPESKRRRVSTGLYDKSRLARHNGDGSDSRRDRIRSPSPIFNSSALPSSSSNPAPDTHTFTRPSRSRTRSLSPTLFAHHPTDLPRSPSPSGSLDGGYANTHLAGSKLAPLHGSAIGDLKSFLSADAAAAKEDERKLKKAQWRARNGLGLQEGVSAEVLLQGSRDEKVKERDERNKRNQDYVRVMQRMKKDGEGAGEGKEKAAE